MGDEFARELTKQAIARACVALGSKTTSMAVLDSLADIVRHFITQMGVRMQSVAEASGRAIPGIQDVLYNAQKFNLRTNSKIRWEELSDFAVPSDPQVQGWNHPFPHQISNFPIRQSAISDRVSLNEPGATRGDYIPQHLPPFPPAHTYKRTQSSKKRSLNPTDENQRQKRAVTGKHLQASLAKIENEADASGQNI